MMSELLKVGIAAAAGTIVAAYAQPKLDEVVKPTTDFQRKAVTAGVAGGSTMVAYWLIAKLK